ncbi:MAG: hypothetical protein ABSE70_02610 [Candidatus Limnocylindrales bacterium]
MDDQKLQERLHEAQIELRLLDKEREALVDWIRAVERLVALRTGGKKPATVTEPPMQLRMPAGPKAPSMRGTVLRVLQEAHGEPLSAREILRRAQALGANTESKDPEATVDLMGYSLRNTHPEMEKIPGRGRIWRWVEG